MGQHVMTGRGQIQMDYPDDFVAVRKVLLLCNNVSIVKPLRYHFNKITHNNGINVK